ncbi:MAG: YigZ family protein [Tannerella sp.]|jgi:uncharacterized YigZ family protein|nr:YigZ family protein [Tannerella sp.]
MCKEDAYLTIKGAAEGYYTEKRSRFIAHALPLHTPEEAKETVAAFRRQYHDARHVCWAYMLGSERKDFRANDDGEPSSTAGKPILGQINSKGLTDILVLVVRYFGGIELGTSRLAAAYRAAAADAIAHAETEERTVDETFTAIFEYPFQNEVMHIIKDEAPTVLDRQFDMDCRITLRIRKSLAPRLRRRLLQVERLHIE